MKKKIVGRVIRVTQTDIDEGCPTKIHACPIARAIKRSLKISRPSVTGEDFVYNGVDYHLPKSCRVFVDRFDGEMGLKVKPFTFRIGKEIK